MENLLETITLDPEESNDLAFKIKLEGASTSPAKVRLVCEGEDFSYMFNGYGTGEDEVVQFTLPKMDSRITEGSYTARVEVLVENRYFAPLNFQIDFKKSLKVVAESLQVVAKPQRPEIKVSAQPITPKVAPTPPSTIKFEQRPPQREREKVSEPVKSGSLREAYVKKFLRNT